MRSIKWIYTLVFVLNYCFLFSQQHNFRNYNVEDGLGQSQVYAMHQDQSGQLWMGTRGGGVSIFNGFQFRNITNKEGLASNYINDIVRDVEGRIWIATNNGITHYDGIHFKTVRFDSGQGGNAVNDINVDDGSNIYFATMAGIYHIDAKDPDLNFKKITEGKINASSVCPDDDGSLWIGTDKGLLHLKDGFLHEMSEVSHYMRNAITAIKKDKKGYLWFGTYGDGVYCYNRHNFFRIDPNRELYRQTVLDIYIDEADNIWLATLRAGVVQYDRGTKIFTFISEQEGLSNNHTRCILKDNNGNFWFGTSGGGVCHYLGRQFTFFDQRYGLGGNFIYSVLRDNNGNLWVGNSQRGVSVIDPQQNVVRYDANAEFANVKVKAIAEDQEGNIWLGTDGNGVYVYRDEKFEEIEELKRTYIKQIKCARDGSIWIATAGNGLIRITSSGQNFVVEKWTTTEGILSNRVTSLAFDINDRLWYATEGSGVGCLHNNRNTISITKENGLASNQIRSLIIDEFNAIWVGTAGDGVCRITTEGDLEIKNINIDNGLTSGNIYLLTFDNDHNLIIGSEKGLDYVYFSPDGSVKLIRHYGKMDGFIGVETCQNAVWNDKNGSIWFGTINGLCLFNPSELESNEVAPVLSLTDIKLFYESIIPDFEGMVVNGKQRTTPVFLYDQNHITFDFIGVDLKRPEEVLYQWKLVGFDDEWSPASQDRSILYSNLNPGRYTFLLKASNEDGVWTENPLSFEFEIETPYWMEGWFQAMVGAGVIFIIILIYILTISRIRRRAKQRQQKVELDKQMLELEQKALRLQMNPHFIFNALNSIQSLIGTGQEKEARYFLAKFSRLMRQILDNSRKNEITLKEEVETIENYLLVEKFANGDRFNYQVNVDPELEPDFVSIPPMLLQPFIENAIKHGMSGRLKEDTAGMITIGFKEENGILECTIEDNGIGREKAAELKKLSKETYHESMSLIVTKERLDMLDPNADYKALEIVDLYDKQGEANGTKVIIRIPIE